MTSVKVIFTPSLHTAVVGYNLHYSGGDRPDQLDAGKIDLGLPEAVNGLITVITPVNVQNIQYYSVRAYNSIGEESTDSNIVQFDPRIDPPTAFVIESV
jgi:hypothetical protein